MRTRVAQHYSPFKYLQSKKVLGIVHMEIIPSMTPLESTKQVGRKNLG